MTTGEIDEAAQPGTDEKTTDTAAATEKDETDTKDEPVSGDDTEDGEDSGAEEEQGDESGEEQAEEAGTGDKQEPVKTVGRAQARIQRQAAELKAERLEKEKLVARLAKAEALEELRQQQQQQGQTREQKQAEEQRLALMSPEEKQAYAMENRLRNLEYQLSRAEQTRADDRDAENFRSKAAQDETYARFADEVEELYQDSLKKNVREDREELLAWKLGKELLKDKAAKAAEKKTAAGRRIASVTTNSASAKGDVAGAKTGKSVEDRLRGQLI